MDMNLSKLQEKEKTEEPAMLQSMGSHRDRYDLVTEQQQQKSKVEPHLSRTLNQDLIVVSTSPRKGVSDIFRLVLGSNVA